MRALVTGGAGFIGSNIVDELINRGHQVVVIDNESAEENDRFYWNEKAENHKLDICDYKKIEPLFKNIDYVFHLAAQSRIQPAVKNPIRTVRVNCEGTTNILQASRENGVKKVIYSSTSACYGLANEPPLHEEMNTDCLNPYSVTKVGGEEICKMYTKLFGLKTVTFRYFNVYGDRQPTRGQYAPVIGLFKKQKDSGKPMTVVGDGLQTRDYTNVKDVVRANILAAESKRVGNGEVINIGVGKSYSVMDLVDMIGGEHVFIPPRIGESRHTLADVSKANYLLEWEPEINLEDWLEDSK
jgi:UDP-glucose 4-epimerase